MFVGEGKSDVVDIFCELIQSKLMLVELCGDVEHELMKFL